MDLTEILRNIDLNRHKTFVSYHHKNDQWDRDKFETMFAKSTKIMIIQSVQIGDIDPELKTETIRKKIRDEYLRKSTVTVVLVGKETWKRKHVDWEIGSSLRNTVNNRRSGLLGIFLPDHPNYVGEKYSPGLIPPRLYDNVKSGYALLKDWSDNPLMVSQWIDDAYKLRSTKIPDNSYPSFKYNKSGDKWT